MLGGVSGGGRADATAFEVDALGDAITPGLIFFFVVADTESSPPGRDIFPPPVLDCAPFDFVTATEASSLDPAGFEADDKRPESFFMLASFSIDYIFRNEAEPV